MHEPVEPAPGISYIDPRRTRRAVAAAAVGNATEWYDFGVFSYLAVIIGEVFFESASPGVQLIASFGIFAAAFVVRPLGGMFFGPLGDRLGRRSVLAATMLLMAVSTFAVGLIPSYASIGFAAPLLLLVARLMQGFSTGGEYGGATTFIAEYAPDRRRGFLGSWLEFGTVSGYLSGALLVTLMTTLVSDGAMSAWGWRVPFLMALPLGAVGLYLRLSLDETPVFVEQRRAEPDQRGAGSLRETFSRHWRAMLICGGIVLVFNVNNYLLTGYLPTYMEEELGYHETTALLLTVAAMLLMLLVVTGVGWISDLVGRRAVLMSGSICAIVLSVPAFWLLQHSVGVALLGTLLLALTLVQFSGTVPSTLPALFPTHVRYAALAVSYNVSVALFGGTTPVLAEALVDATGNLYAPAMQAVVAGVVGLVVVAVMPESAKRPLPGAGGEVAEVRP